MVVKGQLIYSHYVFSSQALLVWLEKYIVKSIINNWGKWIWLIDRLGTYFVLAIVEFECLFEALECPVKN